MIGNSTMTLRRFRHQDRDALVALGDNPRVSQHLTLRFPSPYRVEDAETWLELTGAEPVAHNFAIEWQGRFVGGIGLEPLGDVFSGTAHLGYWLGEPYWGKGLAVQAVALLVPHAFGTLGFARLQAFVFGENTQSMRVLEKSGFTREGVLRGHVRKNGAVMDAVMFGRLREEG